MSSLLAQSSFGPGASPRLYLSSTEQVQTLIPQLRPRAPENFARVPGLSFLYNLGEPIWKILYSWDFQSPVLRSSIRASASAIPPRDFPRLERNNVKLLDAFLFTLTLLNARIKVCYCKNEIFASNRADSVARVARNFSPQSAKLLN